MCVTLNFQMHPLFLFGSILLRIKSPWLVCPDCCHFLRLRKNESLKKKKKGQSKSLKHKEWGVSRYCHSVWVFKCFATGEHYTYYIFCIHTLIIFHSVVTKAEKTFWINPSQHTVHTAFTVTLTPRGILRVSNQPWHVCFWSRGGNLKTQRK